MKIGKVTGAVWSSRKANCLMGQTFLVVQTPEGEVVAADQVGAGTGDRVLLVTGADPAAVRDAGRTGQLLELMDKTNVRLIVNRVAPKLVSTMERTVDDVMDDAGLPLIGVVPEDPSVTLAAAFGKPLLLYTKRGAAAACRRIARRIQGLPVAIEL